MNVNEEKEVNHFIFYTMVTNGHFGETAKSRYCEKQLKKKFIKEGRIPESCKSIKRINICIDFCATFFAMHYTHLKIMEEIEDRSSGKLGDTKRKIFLKKMSSRKKY
jgi:hypothetical protein